MSNNDKKRKIKNLLMGALTVLPGAASTATHATQNTTQNLELSALEQSRMDEYINVGKDAIFKDRAFSKFLTSNGLDESAITDENLDENSKLAVDEIDKTLTLCDAVVASLNKFDKSVDSAFASGTWQDPPPFWKVWASWDTQQCISSQKDAWMNAIKELKNTQSKLENVSGALAQAAKKFTVFYSDKKTANNEMAVQGNLIAAMLDNIRQGLETQNSIDVPETGDKTEALAWRKAMQSLRRLKSSTSGDILNCVNSTKAYLKDVRDMVESLPSKVENLTSSIESKMKDEKTKEFTKMLAKEKRDKAMALAKKEEEEKLRKEQEEKARAEREKQRKEEEEQREREKAERERIEQEEKEKAEKEEKERLAKMREDFDGTRKKLIASLSDKIEKKKIYWNSITNPSDKANADIADILKAKFNVEHEKLDAAGRAKLGEMEAISEFSEDNLKALQDLNEYPSQFGQQVADLNSAVSKTQEELIKTKGDLLQYKANTLDDIAGKKSDFMGYVEKIGLALRKESQPVFANNIAPTQKSIVSGFDDLTAKLNSIEILLTDKKLDDKIKTLKQSMEGLLKKVELSKQNILNQGLKIKKDEAIKSLKSKQSIISENWKKISAYQPSDMPEKLRTFAAKCLQKGSEQTKSVSQGLTAAIKQAESYSLTDIDDEALDKIDIEQSDFVSNHTALVTKLISVLDNELEKFRADRARNRLWDKIYGNLPITEASNDVNRLMDEEKLSKQDAVIRSCVDSLPGTDEYATRIVEGLFKPIERGQPSLTGIYAYGPSGIGKTEAVRYIGQCSGCQLVTITKDSFIKSGFETAKNTINQQTEGRPLLILVDEADTVIPKSSGGSRSESCGGFLNFMDHIRELNRKGNIVVVCTSNVPPTAVEPAAAQRLSDKIQLGDPKYLAQGIAKLLEPVKLNQSMTREQAITDIVGAVSSANLKAQSPDRQIGFRAIKMAILNVCKSALKSRKAAENEFEQPFEEDEFVPKYDLTEADVAVDPENIVAEIAKLV